MGIQNEFSMFPKPKHKKKKREIVSKETYEEVNERDKGRCRLCGLFNNLQLHHIQYRSERKDLINEPSNCIMLCINCHHLVHSNKHKWQEKLKNIILKEILENEY